MEPLAGLRLRFIRASSMSHRRKPAALMCLISCLLLAHLGPEVMVLDVTSSNPECIYSFELLGMVDVGRTAAYP